MKKLLTAALLILLAACQKENTNPVLQSQNVSNVATEKTVTFIPFENSGHGKYERKAVVYLQEYSLSTDSAYLKQIVFSIHASSDKVLFSRARFYSDGYHVKTIQNVTSDSLIFQWPNGSFVDPANEYLDKRHIVALRIDATIPKGEWFKINLDRGVILHDNIKNDQYTISGLPQQGGFKWTH